MSDQGANPPAGWYPDPENPAKQRYWDGTVWSAPQPDPTPQPATPSTDSSSAQDLPSATPPLPGAPGGAVKSRVGVVLIAILAVALIGGGAWALTRDDGDDDERADQQEDTDSDDSDRSDIVPDAARELSEAEFVEEANAICISGFDELTAEAAAKFPEMGSVEDLPEADRERLAELFEVGFDNIIDDFRGIAPEGRADEWLEVVAELDDAVSMDLDALVGGEETTAMDSSSDRMEDDFGVHCQGEDDGSETSTEVATPSNTAGAPQPPPSVDATWQGLVDACYQGDMQACDEVRRGAAAFDPKDPAAVGYGETCGGRLPPDTGYLCRDVHDPEVP